MSEAMTTWRAMPPEAYDRTPKPRTGWEGWRRWGAEPGEQARPRTYKCPRCGRETPATYCEACGIGWQPPAHPYTLHWASEALVVARIELTQ